MNPLLKVFIDLCLFRAGPQDLPCSSWLRNASLIAYFLVGLGLSLSIEEFAPAIRAVALDTLFLMLLAAIPLKLLNKSERISQTLTAIYGSGILFNLALAPFAVMYVLAGNQADPLLATMITAIGLWNLAVLGNIIRYALNLPLIAGIAIAITYLAISSQITH